MATYSVHMVDGMPMLFESTLSVKYIDALGDVLNDTTLTAAAGAGGGKTRFSGDNPWSVSGDGWDGNKWQN
jgi:hypothetical protein